MKDNTARNIAVVPVAIIVIVMALLLSNTWGGTYSKKVPFSYGVVEPDTLRIRVLSLGEASQVGIDTVISTFPDTLVYTLDSASAYEIWKFEQWYGSGTNEPPIVESVPVLEVQADVSGLSTFDESTDSVIVKVGAAEAANGLIPKTEDAVYANRNDYKATGFATHSAADVWTATGGDSVLNAIDDANKGNFKADVSALALQAEVQNIDGWNPITDNDSLIIDQSTLEDMTVATVTDVTNQVTADVTAVDGDAAAADTLEAWLDGYADAQLTNREHLFTNLDEVLSARSKIGDTSLGVDEVQAEVDNLNGWSPHSAADVWAVGTRALTDKVDFALSTAGIDALWEYDTAVVDAGMGKLLRDTSAYQGAGASGVDSGAVARIVGRKVWGVEAGAAGSTDSTALADRKAHVESMKADVVTASVIASSAINASEAPNLDAAITSRSSHAAADVWSVGARTITAGVLTASEWEKVWYDIDTTNIDTSEIGEWFSTGIGASISDANMAAIGDTVWLKLLNAYTATAGCVGDVLYDTLDALVSTAGGSLSDADMGAIADSVWDKIYADMVAEAGGAGDSLWAILNDLLDTLQLYDTRLDSLLAALADANIGDKVWTDAGTRTITGGALTTPGDYMADVSALSSQASVTAIRDSVQYLITATGFSTHSAADVWTEAKGDSILNAIEDANKSNFKATGFATHSAADVWTATGGDSVLNAIDDANKGNFKADVSGVSTFDASTDSVIVDVSSADAGLVPAIEDTIIANANSYKADVSALALEASLFDPATTAVTPTDTTAPGDTLAVKKDSLIFQGAAASPTAVADAVWDEAQSGHTSAGTFGKYLDVEVSSVAGCLGSGSDTLIYYTVDTGNDVRVGGVQVSMYTIGGSQVGGPQTTDANGYVLWALNSGDTLLPIVYGPHQYTWEMDTLIFTGQTADSAMGYRIDDPSPPTPDYATVKGFVISPSGEEFFGSVVTAKRVEGDFASDTSGTPYIVGKKPTSTPIDTLGYFSMFLKRTGTYDDTTRGFYNIVGKMSTGPPIFTVTSLYVPDTGDVDLGLIVGRKK